MKRGEYAMVMVRIDSHDTSPVTGADVAKCELIGRNRKPIEGTRVWIEKDALLTVNEVRERVLAKLGDTR